jgi:hypothetical protein
MTGYCSESVSLMVVKKYLCNLGIYKIYHLC